MVMYSIYLFYLEEIKSNQNQANCGFKAWHGPKGVFSGGSSMNKNDLLMNVNK